MNISYNWLKDYLPIDLSPEKTTEALTSIGLETDGLEEVESIKGGLKGIVIGKVLTCVEHPNSDHLHITTVDLGTGEPTQIVCGAPNVAAGQTVVVATVGTTLYDGDNEFQIKRSKIRGVESLGMICAEDEIGVGSSHDGIIVIPADKAPAPGTPAAEYYNLTSDYVMEVDLTPNRIDAASHFGVARDLAAYLDGHLERKELKRPAVDAFRPDRADGAIEVEVVDLQGAPRYSGLTIRGVKVAPSPQWLRDRLETIGVRSINNIVDITNYILHGIGQPMHAFDLKAIEGGRIVVRTCPDGTPFTTLDGVERKLSDADLMICDAAKPMCIAGVFGGLNSGVTEQTTDIFLESAYFNPTRIRRSARRHGLSTDASFRYERGLDPNATLYALKLAALMVKELAGGEICGEPVDIYPEPVAPFKVDFSLDYLRRLVGKEIPEETVNSILRSLEIETTGRDGDTLHLLVPTYRVDVQRPCDVVEDILRIYGYNNVEINDTVHSALQLTTIANESDDLTRLISDQLTGAGFHEILNNSLTAEAYYADLKAYPADHCVKLLNPLSNDLNVMRQTLLFGGLESIAHNVNRRADSLAFYEFGNVYSMRPDVESTAEAPLAPYSEGARLALWLTGNASRGNWSVAAREATFFDLKARGQHLRPPRHLRARNHNRQRRGLRHLLRLSYNRHTLGQAARRDGSCIQSRTRQGRRASARGLRAARLGCTCAPGAQEKGGIHPAAQDAPREARPGPPARQGCHDGSGRGHRARERAQAAPLGRALRRIRGEEPPRGEKVVRHLDDPAGRRTHPSGQADRRHHGQDHQNPADAPGRRAPLTADRTFRHARHPSAT